MALRNRKRTSTSCSSRVLLLIVGLLACGGGPGQGPDGQPNDDAGPVVGEALHMYVLDCGRVGVKDLSGFNPGRNEGGFLELVNPCYLIRHARGDLIWDTGLSDDLVETPQEDPENAPYTLQMNRTLVSQLAELGLTPGDVENIAMSHLHFDHSDNANTFAGATWLVQEADFEAAFGPSPQSVGFNPATYDRLEATALKLDGDHDVFGDGSVRIIFAPGHTPGHQVLLVDLPETGPVLLSGDLWHFQGNRDERGVPAFNWDREMTLESMDRIESFLVDTGARLVIQHDADHYASVPHAPEPMR